MTMLRRSRIDWIPVLTSEEIGFLDRVKTTKKQARQILCRNVKILRLLEAGTDGEVNIGCPHCEASCRKAAETLKGRCDVCPWTRALGRNARGLVCVCLTVPFGRVTPCSVWKVSYYMDSAYVQASAADKDKDMEALTLVRGHIEWAERVLGIEPGVR